MKRIKIIAFLTAIILCVMPLSGCVQSGGVSDSGKITVVTTVFPPYDFSREIGGNLINLKMLVAPGNDSHYYEPSISDLSAVNNSDVFIYVGGQDDGWINDISDSVDFEKKQTVVLSEKVSLLEEKITEGMQHEEEHHDNENHVEYDEHVWTSLKNAVILCEAIRDAFCLADPDNASVYTNNCDKYVQKLSNLDGRFSETVSNAKRKTVVFAERFPFRYLFEDYGLTCFAAFPGCSSETEPTLDTINFLVNKVKNNAIPAVFYIEFSSMVTANRISEATGAKTLLLHSCHNVSKEDFENGVTYLGLMEQNLTNLTEALN